jgi:hypothetical protein
MFTQAPTFEGDDAMKEYSEATKNSVAQASATVEAFQLTSQERNLHITSEFR